MPLSNVQKGAIGQFAFYIAALVRGGGLIELYIPAADNEGRDAEVRRHLKGFAAIGVQIKVAFALINDRGRGSKTYLHINVHIPEGKVQNDPRLWYFFAVYDSRQLRFLEPVYMIRSDIFYKMGGRRKRSGQVFFEITANMASNSHDEWTPYRVWLKDLGKRLLEIIDEQDLTVSRRAAPIRSDVLVLGRPRKQKASRTVRRAA